MKGQCRIWGPAGRTIAAIVLAALILGHIAVPAEAQEQADPYRLGVGDIVEVSILGESQSWQGRVDLDGMLRLPVLGRTAAEGMSLDETERALAESISETGLFVSPRLSVSVLDYAPVLVSGAVREPGRFDYAGGLTVGAAVGLAGGPSLAVVDSTTLTITATQLAGDLREVEADIQASMVKSARIEAQLADRTDFEVDFRQGASFAGVDPGLIAHLLERERAILVEERDAYLELQRLRQTELEETERQIAFLRERLGVQEQLIRLQAEERSAAEQLEARGLRTRMDMARLERNDAAAQARQLDIEAALSQARTRKADINRAIVQDRVSRTTRLLEASASYRIELDQLNNRRRTLLDKSLIVGNPMAVMLAGMTKQAVAYELHRRVNGGVRVIEAAPADLVRPGDAVVVELIAQDFPDLAGNGG